MEPRVSRASAVIVQRIPPHLADWFMEWQRGVSAVAEDAPGFKGTDIFPPHDNQSNEWVVVLHFEDDKTLHQWLESPIRAEWVEKLHAKAGGFELKALPGGFGAWFAGLTQKSGTPPPPWKMVVTVVLGLYPTVMLLAVFPGPFLNPLGFALSMLIGNALSCSILQWAVMPVLNSVLAPWLKANSAKQRMVSMGGLFAILCLLAGLVVLFRLAKIGER